MGLLIAGLAVFIGSHLVPTRPSLRQAMIDRLGRSGYMAAFSVVSLASLVMIVIGYGQARVAPTAVNPQFWVSPPFMRHITYTLMLVAMILLVAAYVPSRIRDRAKHPMLAALKIWALAHLLVRGDLAGIILFGSLLAYGVYDRISVKHRDAPGPLGRAKGTARGDVIAVIGGAVLFAIMLTFGHSLLIGTPLLKMSFAP